MVPLPIDRLWGACICGLYSISQVVMLGAAAATPKAPNGEGAKAAPTPKGPICGRLFQARNFPTPEIKKKTRCLAPGLKRKPGIDCDIRASLRNHPPALCPRQSMPPAQQFWPGSIHSDLRCARPWGRDHSCRCPRCARWPAGLYRQH